MVSAVFRGEFLKRIIDGLFVILGVEFAVGFAPELASPFVVVDEATATPIRRDPALFLPYAMPVEIISRPSFFRTHTHAPPLAEKAPPEASLIGLLHGDSQFPCLCKVYEGDREPSSDGGENRASGVGGREWVQAIEGCFR